MTGLRTRSLLLALAMSGPLAPAIAAAPALPTLPGSVWHSRHVDGSALFFFIERVGVRFGTDRTFTAAIHLVDGQTMKKDGTYALDPAGFVTLTIPGVGTPQRVRYWGDGSDLIVQDGAYDVTARFVPGPMPADSWF